MNRYAYCKTCGKVFETGKIHMKFEYGDDTCPTPGCTGAAFGIDEEMIVPIMILNKKGYSTKWSCSGHVIEDIPDGYIAFEDEKNFPDSVPNGWYKDVDEDCDYPCCIRCRNNGESYNLVLRQAAINRNMNNLLKWAVELPKNVR